MGLFSNPLAYAGYPADPIGATVLNTTVRAATSDEVEAGKLNDVYVSPATLSSSDFGNFASPPPLGNVTPNQVFATTLSSSGDSTLGTTGATINTLGSSNGSSTTTIIAGANVVAITNAGLSSTKNATLGTTGATVNTIGSNNAGSTTTVTAGASVLAVTNTGVSVLGTLILGALSVTTLTSTGNTTLGTTGATVNTLGSSNASSTSSIIAGASTLSLVDTGGTYPGDRTGTAPASGFIGEQQVNITGSLTQIFTGTPINLATISLTSGIWDITALSQFTINNYDPTAAITMGISTSSATIQGIAGDQHVIDAPPGNSYSSSVPAFRVLVSSTTTYYLVVSAIIPFPMILKGRARLSAVRIA